MIGEFLAGNRRFVENEFGNNISHYQAIAASQAPKLLWIGCADSRVSENVITDSKPGTIFVHRNIANIVAFNDVNMAALLAYGVKHLRIPDIVVCGHYGCGGLQALLDGVEEDYIADWLLIASGAKETVERLVEKRHLSREEKLALLAEENVRLQIKHLKSFKLIKNLHQKGPVPRIHGWIYSLASGEIKVLEDGGNSGGK